MEFTLEPLRAPGVPLEQSVRALEATAVPCTHLADISQLQGRRWPVADQSGSRGSLLLPPGVTATGAPEASFFQLLQGGPERDPGTLPATRQSWA